ncbi:hypothetical protein ACFRCI_42435 [Streptomyces sp. NPDC056638]|uniref:hypothetical protein n=1 Tax=Streptomyces sp. NPDC056638 TaxID=3345887 RepID=UPI00368FF330
MAQQDLFHGLRRGVNLPSRLKAAPPRCQDIRRGEAAPLSFAGGGVLPRVIVGEMDGRADPGTTHTSILRAHVCPVPGCGRTSMRWRAR